MVTAVTGFSNTAASFMTTNEVSQAQQAQEPALSDMAQSLLNSVSKLHDGFQAGMDNLSPQGKRVLEDQTKEADMQALFHETVESLGVAIVMQQQLVQFSMATSMSQSFGNNLNSFLKGS